MYAKDKDKTKSPPPPRPFVPRLAGNTSFVRSPPAAPRLTTVTHTSSPSSSPATRRPISIPNGSAVTPRSPPLAHSNTPVKNVIDDNITPRSSARRSKLSSANSTPRAATSELETTPHRPAPNLDSRTSALGESFFHASDGPSQSPPRRPVVPKQTSSFVYANGTSDESKLTSDHAPEHQSAVAGDYGSVTSWFDKATSSPARSNATASPSKPNSTVSAPAGAHILNSVEPRAPRAPSPTKQNLHLSYRKGASQIIRPEDSRQSFRALSPLHVPSQPVADPRRRQSSLDTISEPVDGIILASVTSARDSPSDMTYSSGRTAPLESDGQAPLPTPTLSANAATSNEPVPPSRFRTPSISSRSVSGAPLSSPREEERNGPQTDSQQSMAAKARQERKVLDLEISNSSLLAINRSLEREIRKQKAEIRRFRRLSRHPTRSSWLSDATSPAEYDDRDDHDDHDEDGEQSDEESESSAELDDLTDQESGSEDAMSAAALAEHDARHLVKDEARLRLDLSKHKELLLESQKMNSSLRRCLGITEQLIKDGGRALEYRVNVADVQLGGRVLSPEEVEMKQEWQDEADSYFLSNWSRESDRLSAASQRLLVESDMEPDVESGMRSREGSGRERDSALTRAETDQDTI